MAEHELLHAEDRDQRPEHQEQHTQHVALGNRKLVTVTRNVSRNAYNGLAPITVDDSHSPTSTTQDDRRDHARHDAS
jgi:hypothetical protein